MSGKKQAGALAAVAALALAAFAAEPAVAPQPTPTRAYLAVLQNGFSIRHQRSEVRADGMTRLYTSAEDYVDVPTARISRVEPEEVVPEAATAAPQLDVPQLIDVTGTRHQLDAEFIRSVVRAESGFDPKAVSRKGAQGLMQLMPATAQTLGVNDAFEPAANLDAGTRYLRDLLEQYHGDVAKALAAYNAGPQRVSQYQGVPPYQETRAYIRRVINDYNRAKQSQKSAATKPAK